MLHKSHNLFNFVHLPLSILNTVGQEISAVFNTQKRENIMSVNTILRMYLLRKHSQLKPRIYHELECSTIREDIMSAKNACPTEDGSSGALLLQP